MPVIDQKPCIPRALCGSAPVWQCKDGKWTTSQQEASKSYVTEPSRADDGVGPITPQWFRNVYERYALNQTNTKQEDNMSNYEPTDDVAQESAAEPTALQVMTAWKDHAIEESKSWEESNDCHVEEVGRLRKELQHMTGLLGRYRSAAFYACGIIEHCEVSDSAPDEAHTIFLKELIKDADAIMQLVPLEKVEDNDEDEE